MLTAVRLFFVPKRVALFYFTLPQRNPKFNCPLQRSFASKKHGQAGNAKLDREQLGRLLPSLRDFLGNVRDHKLVDGFIHKQLDQHLPRLSAPYVAFGKIISLLIEHRFLVEATSVYERMLKDGYVPSPEIDAQMLAVALTLSSESDVDVTPAFDKTISHPSFSEDRFLRLLRLMVKLGVSSEILVGTVERFVETRQDGYSPSQKLVAKLVDAQARAGRLEDAFETILQYDLDASEETPTRPYVAIISAIKHTNPSDSESLHRTLELMKENGIEPDISVLNALISRELRERSLHKAFSMYAVVKQLSKSSHLSPDAFTFASLFTVLTNLYKPSTRGAHPRPYENHDKIIPPRQLYHDMISAYSRYGQQKSRRSPFELTSSLLNVALRAFILKRDYAGAFVILRSFLIFGRPISTKTYYIVMKHVMNRLLWDIKGSRRIGESRWGDKFLGIKSQAELDHIKVDRRLALQILDFGKQPIFDLSSGICASGEAPVQDTKSLRGKHRTHTTPTLDMIDGDAPVPEFMQLDSVPLERILRRAILADVQIKSVDDIKRPVASHVSKAITNAKKEMVPELKGSK